MNHPVRSMNRADEKRGYCKRGQRHMLCSGLLARVIHGRGLHFSLIIAMAALLASCQTNNRPSPSPSVAPDGRKSITVGGGGLAGVYYAVGKAICRFVHKDRKTHGIRCSAVTGNSIFNLHTVHSGEMDFGLAQSDLQSHAYTGSDGFTDAGFKDLRAVFSVHSEPLTVIARADSGIRTFNDLKGKRVNIGARNSGMRRVMNKVMVALGWTGNVFKLDSRLSGAESSVALCDDKVDAIFFVAGYPSGTVKAAANACKTVIIGFAGTAIDKLVAENGYFRHVTIPGGTYRIAPDDVDTIGVSATVVTSARTPAESVYAVAKSVFENFASFKKLHPAFSALKKQEMVKESLTAPLHEGALKYYMEAGLM
jgi:uncharacterized protein